MLLSTFWIDYPILRDALSHAPEITVSWKQSDLIGDDTHQMLVWVDGNEFEAFDAGLEADTTVNSPSRVVEFDDRRFYQLELTPTGHRKSVYPLVVEEGTVLQDVMATHKGWKFRTAFPSNDALERFHSFFLESDVEFEIRRLYDEQQGIDGSRYGVTEQQYETLVAAVDTGYLDIPRSSSLAELADGFDISPNAASERFRRGTKTLVENSIYPEDEQT